MENTETRFNRPRRSDDDSEVNSSSEYHSLSRIFPALGKAFGAMKTFSLDPFEKIQAHTYVLTQCELVENFREKFRIEVRRMNRGKRTSAKDVEQYVHKHFHKWFRDHVLKKEDPDITPEIELLAQGPNDIARRFSGYNIHGFKFRTKGRDQGLKTQNSGVVMSANTKSVSVDANGKLKSMDILYHGRLVDIIELNYFGKLRVVMFKCEWVDPTPNRGTKVDEFGITSVNFSRLVHIGTKEIDEPFILAADARMAYYVDDPVDQGWSCVCHVKPRDLYDMGDESLMYSEESIAEDIPFADQHLVNIDHQLHLVRDDANEEDQDQQNSRLDDSIASDSEDGRMSE